MPRKASGEIKTRTVKVKQKNGDVYVYERRILYNPEKRYNETLESHLIGKIFAGTEQMVPTRPKKSGAVPLCEVTAQRERTGMMDILAHIGEVSGIDALLYNCTDCGTAQKIISLARYIAAANGQPLPLIEVFQLTHPLPYEDGISERIYHDLFQTVGRDAAIEQRFFLGRCRDLGTKPSIAYDSTTIATYADGQIDARYNGRKASDSDLKKIKFLVLYELRTCQPLAFRKLAGNISDVVTISNAIEQLKVLGIEDAELVTDNGYYALRNIATLLSSGFNFITRIKTSVSWVAEAIDAHLDLMDDPAAAVSFDTDVHAVCVAEMRDFERIRKYGSKKKGLNAGDREHFRRRVYLHLYCNRLRQVEKAREFDDKLLALRDLLESGTSLEELPDDLRDLTERYMHIKTHAGKTTVTFNIEACRDKKKRLGFFALIANKRRDSFDCLCEYRRRTLIELCFEDYKDKTDGSRPRVWSSDALQGRMFVQFVALCYLEYFAGMIKELKETLGCPNGDEQHDKKAVLAAEKKLRSWLENTSLHQVLQWFDVVETTDVSVKQRQRRWSSEMTARDQLFLEKLGVT